MGSVQDNMRNNGFDFGTSSILAQWNTMKKKRSGPATLTFPCVATARGFFYQYKDYEWEGDNGTQTLIIRLHHATFDAELLQPDVRLLLSKSFHVTATMVNSVASSLSV